MNAPVRSDTLDPRQSVELAWHHAPEAQTLLADCAITPPHYVSRKLASHERWSLDDEFIHGFDRNDDRVDALIRLSSRAFEDAQKAGAPVEILRKWPCHDTVIRAAIAAAHRKAAA
jgi:hypothetical protein